jgi:hypothetical protein
LFFWLIFSGKSLRVQIVTVSLLLVVISLSTFPAHAVLLVGRNIDIAGETGVDRQRVEPTIAVDPHNSSIIVAGAQDLRLLSSGGHRWHGYYRSTDNGQTWSSSLLPGFPGDTSSQGLSSPLHGFNATSDPVLAFDRNGNLYYTGVAISRTSSGFMLKAFVAKFVNDGADYARATIIAASDSFADKPWIAVDATGGANDGNVYLAFDGTINNGLSGVVFTRSTNGGLTFASPILVTTDGALPGIAVDAGGNIFVSAIQTSGHNILVSKSTDGGLSFSKPFFAAMNITPLPTALPGNRFRTTTIPQIAADASGVFIVWDDFRTRDSNVMFARSLNGGVTWSNPLIVNDVTANQQFFSSIAVSSRTISVIWYDSRLGQLSNGTITGLDVFYARSTNAGSTFSASIRLTSTSFNPNLVERTDFGDTQIFMGDYIQVGASPSAVHPIWTDNRNACGTVVPTFGCVDQDAFTTTITF